MVDFDEENGILEKLLESGNFEKFYQYLEQEIEKEDIPKFRFWLTNALATLGLPAGAPFYPAGLDLASRIKAFSPLWRKISGYALSAAGTGINSILYHGFAKFVIDFAWNNFSTPESLKDLMPEKYSKKSKALFGFGFLCCALLSTLDYYAMSEETKSQTWNIVINVLENAIIHLAAFILSVQSDNFLFHQHLSQPISAAVRKKISPENAQAYRVAEKNNFIIDDLYNEIFANFKKAYSGNYDRRSIAEVIQQFQSTPAPSRKYTNTRKGIALTATVATDWSLGGYFTGGYLAAKDLIKKKKWAFLNPPIAILGNLFFVYLVNNSVYNKVNGIVDSIVNMSKNGLKATLLGPNWAKQYPGMWYGILSVAMLIAAFSFSASVELVYDNFLLIGLAALVIPTVIVTMAFTGFFNGVQIDSFGKSAAEIRAFASKESSELIGKMKFDYNAELTLAQVSKLPKETFLALMLQIIIQKCNGSSYQKDTIVQQVTGNKLDSTDEFSDFLTRGTTPGYYKNKAAFYIERTVDSVKESIGCCARTEESRPLIAIN